VDSPQKPIKVPRNCFRLYEPNREAKQGFLESFAAMTRDLKMGRELGIRLFKRDLAARYRQSMLGFLWILVFPLLSAAIFVALNRSGIINAGNTGLPYVVYVLFGLTLWNLFMAISINMSKVLGETASLLTKINFTRISLAFPPVLSAFVDFGIRGMLLGAVMIFCNTSVSLLGVPLLFLVLIPLVLLSIGIGLFAAVAGAVIKDIPNILTVVFTFLMFLTPVVYPLSGKAGVIGRIGRLNPLTALFDCSRSIFFYGKIDCPAEFIIATTLSVVLFLLGWRFYYVAIGRIAEKV
jgi:lipopolysaccharide transport system permease protein